MAAGKSERMGTANKLLLEYNDHTIIEEVLTQLNNSCVDNIVIVTGHECELIEKKLSKKINNNIAIIKNENYDQGRVESIKCALRYLSGKCDAALFMVGDKPEVKSKLLSKAVSQFRELNPAILETQTPDGPGHPIIFSSRLFDEILEHNGMKLRGELIARHKNDVVVLHDDTSQPDIDTPAEYRKLTRNY